MISPDVLDLIIKNGSASGAHPTLKHQPPNTRSSKQLSSPNSIRTESLTWHPPLVPNLLDISTPRRPQTGSSFANSSPRRPQTGSAAVGHLDAHAPPSPRRPSTSASPRVRASPRRPMTSSSASLSQRGSQSLSRTGDCGDQPSESLDPPSLNLEP